MDSQASRLTLGLLPEPRTRWQRFVLGYGAQSLALSFLAITAVIYPEVLVLPVRDYHFIGMVGLPRPVPQTPAPARNFPEPRIAELAAPRPEALLVPSELVQAKKLPVAEEAPKITLAASKVLLPEVKPMIPRPPIRTNVFLPGSSATPSMAAAPQRVQTGGFGDPNGAPASENRGRPVTIAQAGSFDMPSGPSYGNGTGGSHGARGVVASTGFGSGVATGDSSGPVSFVARGAVRQGGFGDADMVAASQPKASSAEPAVKTSPAEITFKPRPVYTEEGRQLKIEGEVLLDVVFSATGQIRIVKVVRGLGHGLDESAAHAAEKIQFKPAQEDGHPADFEAVLHITFQLAS
jgi:TonB family protein